MAKSVNKVILVGNVGQNPEVKYTASGVPVARVSLATNERFKDKNDAWQDRTEWHTVVAWRKLWASTRVRARSSTSKANCRRRAGKTSRVAKGNTGPRLLPGTLFCSARGTMGRRPGEKCPASNPLRNLPPQ